MSEAVQTEELPEGWEWKKLGEIATTSSGGTPRRSQESYYGGDIPWLKIGDLNDGLVTDVGETITELGLENSSAHKLSSGTLLIAMYGSIGKLGILAMEAATNQAICAIEPTDLVLRDFLYWYLRSQKAQLLAAGFGGTQANISQGFLRDLRVPVPPTEQQERLVQELERLFLSLDVGLEALNESETAAKAFKEVAFRGATRGSWPTECLGDLGTWIGGGTPSKRVPRYWEGEIPWVSPKDMKVLELSETQDHISSEAVEKSAANFFPADCIALVVRSGILEHTLPIALVPFRATANQDMRVLSPKATIDKRWLLYALRGQAEQIRRHCRKDGTTVASIDARRLQDFKIQVPPEEVQGQIAQEVEQLLEAHRSVETRLEQACVHHAGLKQAILRDAFQGRLKTKTSF